jgi:TRAP-type C4-dicarboxylate transport system permease large subunit
MVFLILMGASVFTPFIALSGLPALVTGAFTEGGLCPYVVLLILLAVYAVLG